MLSKAISTARRLWRNLWALLTTEIDTFPLPWMAPLGVPIETESEEEAPSESADAEEEGDQGEEEIIDAEEIPGYWCLAIWLGENPDKTEPPLIFVKPDAVLDQLLEFIDECWKAGYIFGYNQNQNIEFVHMDDVNSVEIRQTDGTKSRRYNPDSPKIINFHPKT